MSTAASPGRESSSDSQPQPGPNAGAGVPRFAVTGLFLLAVAYTLHLARGLLIPIAVAIILFFILSPLVRAFQRAGVPRALSAGILILVFFIGLGLAAYEVAGPARDWMARLPQSIREVSGKLEQLRRPMERVTEAARKVEQMAVAPGAEPAPEVKLQQPGLIRQIFGGTVGFVSSLFIVVFLTFFLLSLGDRLLQKIVSLLPAFRDKRRAVAIARDLEKQISAYLGTASLIYIGVGAATASIAYLVGLPNPILWGVIAAVLNYVPILGAIGTLSILTLVGLLTFDGIGHALIAPAAFGAVNVTESYVVTPIVLGRRLILNPLSVFLGLLFWGFVWGIAGALLAIPMLAAFKIFCDHVEALKPVGELMGD